MVVPLEGQQAIPNPLGPGDGFPNFFKLKPEPHLEQGDILPRSAGVISEVLRKYHAYNVDKAANEMFAVLTQSCDLLPHNGVCKARYISFAPVRPLRLVLAREFFGVLLNTPGDEFILGSEETKGRYLEFLHRLINNNDPKYFFVPQSPERSIAEDMCIILPIALAIRIEHYGDCVSGRVAQIDDLFQAKLGWLLGQQYSRVGTPDWSSSALDKKISEVSSRSLTWLPDHQFEQVKKGIKKFEIDKPGEILTFEGLEAIRASTKSRIDSAIDALYRVLEEFSLMQAGSNTIKPKIRSKLKQTPDFTRHFKL